MLFLLHKSNMSSVFTTTTESLHVVLETATACVEVESTFPPTADIMYAVHVKQ